MAQLLAGGIIVFGLVIIALAIFLVRREKSVQSTPAATLKTQQHTTPTLTTPEATLASAPTPPAPVAANVASAKGASEEDISALPGFKDDNAIRMLYEDTSLPLWWHEQFDSLIIQVQDIREHAKDVERQIAILDEIATRAAELESLQRKHVALPESKISLFPIKVHRQPTDGSYLTDKRPVVRKYTINLYSYT